MDRNISRIFAEYLPQYKTQFCKNLTKKGHCSYGKFCNFAHTKDELREHELCRYVWIVPFQNFSIYVYASGKGVQKARKNIHDHFGIFNYENTLEKNIFDHIVNYIYHNKHTSVENSEREEIGYVFLKPSLPTCVHCGAKQGMNKGEMFYYNQNGIVYKFCTNCQKTSQ